MSGGREVADWRGQESGDSPAGLPLAGERPVTAADLAPLQQGQRALLGDAIERAIIPQLILQSRERPLPGPRRPAATGDSPLVIALTAEVLRGDVAAGLRRLEALQEGWSFARICLEALGPSARLLGRMWEEDRCDFLAVTEGVIGLQRLMRAITPPAVTGRSGRDGRHRILLASLPGEDHRFGLEVVAEFFRQDGWLVRLERDVTHAGLAAMVQQEWFAIAGFSVTCDQLVSPLGSAILAVRRASRNPGLAVLIGGPLIARRPELVTLVGADTTGADGPDAVARANQLVGMMRFTD